MTNGTGPSGVPVTRGEVRTQLGIPNEAAAASMDTGQSAWSLIMCTVQSIDWEVQRCVLRPMSGTREEKPFTAGTPITFAGGGRRHFFGAMPMVGDYCVVGWISGNSMGQAGSRLPIILSWFPPPWWMGRDWIPGSDMAPGEGLDLPEQLDRWDGIMSRVRFKLRHMEPGHIVASSGQGADMVLDESVTFANRRGNELRLRDQDQALVVRSVNQFHAMSGCRIYAGPVRRDAQFLQSQMFSDGYFWDTPQQYVANDSELTDLTESGFLNSAVLGKIPDIWSRGDMTPGEVFQRHPSGESDISAYEEAMTAAGTPYLFPDHIDPYSFLAWGAFCAEDGAEAPSPNLGSGKAIYGGKVMYRVGTMPLNSAGKVPGIRNQINQASTDALTTRALAEYRIEVAHDSDCTLPVTEQTDGFDADRLPSGMGSSSSGDVPFIEMVYGSVVGNDPFKEATLYGLPLVPKVFDGTAVDANIVSGIGHSPAEHAATLFRMKSPTGGGTTWWSVTKSSHFLASLGGTGTSAEIACAGSVKLRTTSFDLVGGGLRLQGTGNSQMDYGIDMSSPSSAIRIYGGGETNEGRVSRRNEAEQSSEADTPSLHLEGRRNVLIQAERKVEIHAAELDLTRTQKVILGGQNSLEFASGDKLTMSGKAGSITTTGTRTDTCSGGNPMDGACFTRTITCNPTTGAVPFTVQQDESIQMGNRLHNIDMGDNDRVCRVGNQNIDAWSGDVVLNSLLGANSTRVTTSGMSSTMLSGNISSTAVSGAVTCTGMTGVNITALGGPISIRSTSAVMIAAPGAAPGPVTTGGTRCTITGLPYLALTNCQSGVLITP